MRALVLSGGGSKGAFAGGVAQHLIQDLGFEYDMIVGTSTGSLLAPMLAAGDLDNVRKAYTSVTQEDIYSTCPFRIKKLKDGSIKSSINHFNILRMFLMRKKTFGEHLNLKKTIRRFFPQEHFERIRNSNTKVIVTVANLSLKKVEYKYLRDHSYEDFCDWMWASSSFVPFMSLAEKNGYEYADGGFGNYIPIEEAISQGASDIHVIVLSPRNRTHQANKTRNAFDIMMHSLQFTLQQIAYDDILIGHLQSIYNDNINVKFFFTPRMLTEYSFHFDPELMSQWWNEGYEYAKMRMRKVVAS